MRVVKNRTDACVHVAAVFGLDYEHLRITVAISFGSHSGDGPTYDEAVVQTAKDVTQDDHLAQVEVYG